MVGKVILIEIEKRFSFIEAPHFGWGASMLIKNNFLTHP
jgi:hypothetical protein